VSSVFPNFLGALAVRWRVDVTQKESFLATLKDEFNFRGEKEANVKWTDVPESKKYVVSSWLASFITVLHLVMGTVVLSSALFISSCDAVTVAVRFLMSAIVFRMILMSELHIMKDAVKKETTIGTRVYDAFHAVLYLCNQHHVHSPRSSTPFSHLLLFPR
jgi:hypothetical protein